jgi:hypothetical protein
VSRGEQRQKTKQAMQGRKKSNAEETKVAAFQLFLMIVLTSLRKTFTSIF